MKVTETFLKGCFILEPLVFGDKRGSFIETFNKKTFQEKTGLEVDFVQDNQSISLKGVLRGFLHGFVTLENDTIFSYKVDNFYNKESEYGVIYNDEVLGRDWLLKKDEIILSEKDKELCLLANLK